MLKILFLIIVSKKKIFEKSIKFNDNFNQNANNK